MSNGYDIPPPPNQRVDDPAGFQGIAIEGVEKSFGPKTVLDGTDLLIHKGETIVIIGRSGEGKSVLLKHIVRLLDPDKGRIWVEGTEIAELADRALMELRKKYAIKHLSRDARAVVKELRYRLDISDLSQDTGVNRLELNEIGRLTMRTTQPLFFDPYRRNRETGSFILIDEGTNATVGAGMII